MENVCVALGTHFPWGLEFSMPFTVPVCAYVPRSNIPTLAYARTVSAPFWMVI